MDERVEEIRSISRIRPVRKVALARPRRGGCEMIEQPNRYYKAIKPKRKNFVKKKQSKNLGLSNVLQTNYSEGDVKKRIAFDRTMILGE